MALFAPFYNFRGKARNFFVISTTNTDLGIGTRSVADRLEPVPKIGGRRRRILRKFQRVPDVADFLTHAVRRDRSLVQNFHRIKDHDRSAVGTIHDVDPRVCSVNLFYDPYSNVDMPAI
jgi:hypothetical protein